MCLTLSLSASTVTVEDCIPSLPNPSNGVGFSSLTQELLRNTGQSDWRTELT